MSRHPFVLEGSGGPLFCSVYRTSHIFNGVYESIEHIFSEYLQIYVWGFCHTKAYVFV